MTRRPAVFLDRDGVLNETGTRDGVPIPPPDVEHFRLLPDVAEACVRLAGAGLALVVVTNQPDVSRGTLDPAELDACDGSSDRLITAIEQSADRLGLAWATS